MDHSFLFRDLNPCEQVDHILNDASLGEEPYQLWDARTHAIGCLSCQQRHVYAVSFLSDRIRQEEAALALRIEEIRGDYIRDISVIGQEAILARSNVVDLPFDDILLTRPSSPFGEETGPEKNMAFALISRLARAGRRVKSVFATIHGEGLAWFNVVPNLNDPDETFAVKACAGLVRQLSAESREFAFAASLAAEVLPDVTWNPDAAMPSGAHLGVLYKTIQAAATRYLERYLAENPDDRARSTQELNLERITMVPSKTLDLNQTQGLESESLISGQTAMMGSLSDIEKALRELLEKTSSVAKGACESTLRDALGSQFHQLSETALHFLRTAEYGYTQFPSDLDFSLVVVNLMKAFEVEFHRAIEPFAGDLEQLAARDISFRGEITTFTLGAFYKFLRKHESIVEPLFRQYGLQFEGVCNAIYRVNGERGAKHSSVTTKADATHFRAIFLGRPSILTALRKQL